MKNLCLCVALYLCFLSSASASDEQVGLVKTVDGEKIYIRHHLATLHSYFVKADNRYIPLSEVQRLTRIQFTNSDIQFAVRSKDGKLLEARHGQLVFQQVKYTYNGEEKSTFMPVMKGRGSNGLFVQQYNPENGKMKLFEIVNPNNISEYIYPVVPPNNSDVSNQLQTTKPDSQNKGGNFYHNLLG